MAPQGRKAGLANISRDTIEISSMMTRYRRKSKASASATRCIRTISHFPYCGSCSRVVMGTNVLHHVWKGMGKDHQFDLAVAHRDESQAVASYSRTLSWFSFSLNNLEASLSSAKALLFDKWMDESFPVCPSILFTFQGFDYVPRNCSDSTVVP